jgi:Pentapeptide repeats (8 copies)
MANQEHLDLLKQGVETWNQWRKEHPETQPDLQRADLIGVSLRQANLLGANLLGAILSRANLFEATLFRANLFEANLSEADLFGATFTAANLRRADLTRANLTRTTLSEADFSEANLTGANLSEATIVRTKFTKAILTDCWIYGISAWDVEMEEAQQLNLVITPPELPTITVDNLEVAQFIYLLLNNPKIRDVIDTIAKKAILILGRFTPKRKVVLDELREALRKQDYLPILFDFEKPASRDITETISTLAHLARFVIADITDAKSIPQELMAIVPNLPSVAVQPLILNSQHEYGMFEHFTRFSWVLPIYRYTDEASLLQSLQENVIAPAELKAKELEKRH